MADDSSAVDVGFLNMILELLGSIFRLLDVVLELVEGILVFCGPM